MTATHAVATLDVLKERKRLMDDVWLLTLASLLVAVGVPWFQRILDVNFAPVAWSVFAFGCAYLLVSAVAERSQSRWLFLCLALGSHAAGVITLGALWRLTGGLQNPMFLLIFVLPVITASLLLPRWSAHATAALSLVTVITVAAIDSPALRWYSQQLGLPVEAILGVLVQVTPSTVRPFPGVPELPPYLALLVFLFGTLLFAVAMAGGAVGQLTAGLQQRLRGLTTQLSEAEGLSLETVRSAPWPAVLLHAETGRVAHASDSFLAQFFLHSSEVIGRDLVSLICFSYPDAVEELVTGGGGVLSAAVCHVSGDTRVLQVDARPLTHGDQRYVYLSLLDTTERLYWQMTGNALQHLVIVIDPRGRIRHFNRAAQMVFETLEPGIDAAIPLQTSELPAEWWSLRRRTRQYREVRVAGRRYGAECIGMSLEGERDTLNVITLFPIGDEE